MSVCAALTSLVVMRLLLIPPQTLLSLYIHFIERSGADECGISEKCP